MYSIRTKSNTGRKKDANESTIEDDPDNPFGLLFVKYMDPNGKVTSAMNMVGSPTKAGSGEEGHGIRGLESFFSNVV